MNVSPPPPTAGSEVGNGEIVIAVRRALGSVEKASLHEPEFQGNEWAYVKDCIDSGWVSSVGAYVDRFERMLADYTGVGHAVATMNGTAALHLSLLLAGVSAEDEVLIPSLTFIATANAVSYIGAMPHFVDSDPDTLSIDVDSLAAYLDSKAEISGGACRNRTTGRRIAALVVMHTFGHVGPMERLVELANRWGLPLVEDAAESLGSTYRGRHAGSFGLVSSLSFNGNKVVTTGGGGAVLTNDATLAKRAKHLSTTARVAHRWSFIHDEVGYNYRLPNINAALGCAQLERLDDFVARKRTLAARYIQEFASLNNATIVSEPESCSSNYWLMAMMLDDGAADMRDDLLQALNDDGIMARPVWTLMHRLGMFSAAPRMSLPNAESIERRLINLPSSPKLAGFR